MKKIIFGSSCMIFGAILFLSCVVAGGTRLQISSTNAAVLFLLPIILAIFGFLLGIFGLLEKKDNE